MEIEFAVAIDRTGRCDPRFGFLLARPMMVSREEVAVTQEEMQGHAVIVSSDHVLGNGACSDICDIVYLRPEAFEARHTNLMVTELADVNRELEQAGRPYLLIGFGRWGSSDPWLGVPVDWGQISGARVIVEATLPQMNPDLSQGSHFFHNLISFKVLYLSVSHTGSFDIRWDWLDKQPAARETRFTRHLRVSTPLSVRVDGRSGRGVITHAE